MQAKCWRMTSVLIERFEKWINKLNQNNYKENKMIL